MSDQNLENKCLDVQSKLDDYVDGTLPPLEDREVKAHLYKCPQCAKEVEELFFITEQLEMLDSLPTNTELLTKKIQKTIAKDGKWRRRKLRKLQSLAAALIVLGIGLGFLYPRVIPTERSGDDIAFHSIGKKVYVDGSQLLGDLTVVGGDVYVQGPVKGSVTSIDGQVSAMVQEESLLSRLIDALGNVWHEIWSGGESIDK